MNETMNELRSQPTCSDGEGAMASRGCVSLDPPRGDRAMKTDVHSNFAYSPRALLPGHSALRREKVKSSAPSNIRERPNFTRGIASRLIASLGTPLCTKARLMALNVAASAVETSTKG